MYECTLVLLWSVIGRKTRPETFEGELAAPHVDVAGTLRLRGFQEDHEYARGTLEVSSGERCDGTFVIVV